MFWMLQLTGSLLSLLISSMALDEVEDRLFKGLRMLYALNISNGSAKEVSGC